MKPLLAHIYEPHRVTYPCYVQPKLNGIRALYQNGCFQSRDQLPFPVELLRHLSRPLQSIFDPSTILDGELYVHGWPLQRINAAVTPVRQEPTEDTKMVEYHVFDSVDFTKPFQDRLLFGVGRILLGACLPQIKEVPSRFTNFSAIADEFYARWVSEGYEGLMYRLGDCPYTRPKQEVGDHNTWLPNPGYTLRSKFLSDKDNRTWHLLKRKDWQDDEFECVGVEEGEGKLRGMLGALICEVWANTDHIAPASCTVSTFSVGSGLTDSERSHYWSNPPIGRLIKVKYLVLSEAGIPLNPTILAIL